MKDEHFEKRRESKSLVSKIIFPIGVMVLAFTPYAIGLAMKNIGPNKNLPKQNSPIEDLANGNPNQEWLINNFEKLPEEVRKYDSDGNFIFSYGEIKALCDNGLIPNYTLTYLTQKDTFFPDTVNGFYQRQMQIKARVNKR